MNGAQFRRENENLSSSADVIPKPQILSYDVVDLLTTAKK